MSADVIYLPLIPPPVDDTPSPHWLIFDAARQITGCACGYKADLDSDCGYGDSIVDHLLTIGSDQ